MNRILHFSICIAGAFCFGNAAYAQDVQSAAAAAAAAMSKADEVSAQESSPRYWNNSAQFDLGLNHTGLNDWAAGGNNTLNFNTGLDANALYNKGLIKWDTRLQLQYGFFWSSDKEKLLQKSNDRIYLESKFSYKTGKESKWGYTASYNFRSQFNNTFDKYKLNEDGVWEGTLKSGFLSPAYTDVALGIDWVPNKWLSLNLAPLTGGVTIVKNEALRKSYGMPGDDDNGYGSIRFELGAQIKADAKFVINEVFSYQTQLVLFTDYLADPFTKMRVNWDNKISWSIAKYFRIDFNTWLIYDPKVLIKNDKDLDQYPDGRHRIQLKEYLAFNFTYTLKTREKR